MIIRRCRHDGTVHEDSQATCLACRKPLEWWCKEHEQWLSSRDCPQCNIALRVTAAPKPLPTRIRPASRKGVRWGSIRTKILIALAGILVAAVALWITMRSPTSREEIAETSLPHTDALKTRLTQQLPTANSGGQLTGDPPIAAAHNNAFQLPPPQPRAANDIPRPTTNHGPPISGSLARDVTSRALQSMLNADRDWTHVWTPDVPAFLICGLKRWEITQVSTDERVALVLVKALVEGPGQRWDDLLFGVTLQNSADRLMVMTVQQWTGSKTATGLPTSDERLYVVSGWQPEVAAQRESNTDRDRALSAAFETAIKNNDHALISDLSRQATSKGAATVAARYHLYTNSARVSR